MSEFVLALDEGGDHIIRITLRPLDFCKNNPSLKINEH